MTHKDQLDNLNLLIDLLTEYLDEIMNTKKLIKQL